MAHAPTRSPHPPALRRLAERLESYRERNPRPRRLPDEIWKRAAALARAYGVNAVARALRLNYYALKRRVSTLPAARPTEIAPNFVEVCVGAGGTSSGGTLELEDGTGRRMKVTLGVGAGLDLEALVTTFWEAGA